MTYKNIIELFEQIATSHMQLKGFGSGELWEVNGDPKNSGKYPELWIVPVSSAILDSGNTYTFRTLVYDRVYRGEDNELDVLSDTHQMLTDVIRIIKYNSDEYDLIGSTQLEPFTERFDDAVSGWSTLIQLQVQFPTNYCDIPLETPII